MPTPHTRHWHRSSVFGPGPRRPLDREQRARFRYLLTAHRRARRISPLTEIVGNALVRRLGVTGQCDPAHDTIAADAGCCARTVRRALTALKALGLVVWQCRLVRTGWRVAQTSNSYVLAIGATPPSITPNRPFPTAGQSGRETLQSVFKPMPPASATEIAAAQSALADRRRAIEARLGK